MVLENSNEVATPETEQGGLTRRSLVRTGATAAWAVPVITAVAAAPALAASGPADLSSSTETVNGAAGAGGNGAGTVTGTIHIVNSNSHATTGLSITFTGQNGAKFVSVTSPSSGWTVSGTGSGTLTLTASTQLNGNSSRDVTINFTTNGQQARHGTFAISPGSTGTPGSGTF